MTGNELSRREIEALEKLFDARIKSIEKATDVASSAMQKRLEGMNEFRETLKDQASRFVTREELQVKTEAIGDKIYTLEKYKNIAEGKASQNAVNAVTVISVVSLIVGVLSLLLKVL